MIKLYQKRARFIQCAEKQYMSYSSTLSKDLAITSGTLNFIWNLWNSFWRYFFIAYALGGYDCNKNKIIGFIRTLRQNEVACFYQCVKNNKPYITGRIVNYYSEITWGDPDVITMLLSSSLVNIPNSTYLLSLLSTYYDDISDFQKIRNSFIHMNTYGLASLERNVLPRYSLSSGQKTVDILDGISLNSNNQCFRTILDSMNAFLSYI